MILTGFFLYNCLQLDFSCKQALDGYTGMSKSKKLRDRLGTLPKDFTWDELVTLLGHYGFDVFNNAGSKRKFVNEHGRLVSFHCPHPGSIVKGYVLKEVKTLLDELDDYE